MYLFKEAVFSIITLMALVSCRSKQSKSETISDTAQSEYYKEPYRPQFHFSPEGKWMNDPNGLVFHKGVYHLFYQHYPEDIVWGPMHWGHAVSKDLVHWEHRPIALFPDKNGYIFSGSAVLDVNNTSGLGSLENPPLVAIFTYHDAEGEKAGHHNFQTQGIAYSLDNGENWEKYGGNPVIPNEGIRDFRDPKVFWNDMAGKWTMLLVAGDHLQIWNSDNLREWKKISEFGKGQGAHGGVWECPDMFPLVVEGTDEKKWVLLISINPGAPNGGSGTQYFLGDFDGKTFTSYQEEPRWMDWGTDNYAGVTYNNVPSEDRIFIGWMSNWNYANSTPTEKWRSAMTLPRKLSLRKTGKSVELISYPIENLNAILKKNIRKDLSIKEEASEEIAFANFNQSEVRFRTTSKNFILTFKNDKEEQLVLEMDASKNIFKLDRSHSGETGFHESFGRNIQQMPIPDLPEGEFEIRIIMDRSSMEVFINEGQYVMTAQIFPTEDYTVLVVANADNIPLNFHEFTISKVNAIWQ